MGEYAVYMHTSPNGKVYIGITKQKPKYRWGRGSGYRTNEYFTRAILKYGWDNFKHEIIKDHLSFEDAANLEINMIASFKSDDPDYGYNHSKGGENTFARDKQDLHYGKSPKSKKVVQYDLEGNFIAEWESLTKAADSLEINFTNISRCCSGKTRFCKSSIWFYKGDDTNEAVTKRVSEAKKRYREPMSDAHKQRISIGVMRHFSELNGKAG